MYPWGTAGFWQGVAQVRAQVEMTPFRHLKGVGDGLRHLAEESLHLGRGLQVEMVVGPQMRQGLVDGDVETSGDQGVLETGTLRGMVVDVVGGHQRNACIPGYSRQPPVAVRVSLQEILLQLYVHGAGTEPVQIPPKELLGLTDSVFHGEAGEGTVAASGEKDDALRVMGQVRGVQPGIPAVDVVGQGEEAGDVGVPRPRLCKQREAGAVGEGQFPAGDGPDAQVVGQPGELQGTAQVGVRKGKGGVVVLLGR